MLVLLCSFCCACFAVLCFIIILCCVVLCFAVSGACVVVLRCDMLCAALLAV